VFALNLTKQIFALSILFTMANSEVLAKGSPKDADFLARAKAANDHCKVLTAPEAAELNSYVAAFQGQEEQAALKRGAAIGNSVQCDSVAARGVRGVLQSARRKNMDRENVATEVVAAPVTASDAAPAKEVDQNRIQEPKQKEKTKPTSRHLASSTLRKKTQPRKVNGRQAQPTGGLRRYESLATSYFRALRCGEESNKSLVVFYSDVINMHRKLVNIYGAGRVGAAAHRAEARANAGHC
jgi:hypothetical protein